MYINELTEYQEYQAEELREMQKHPNPFSRIFRDPVREAEKQLEAEVERIVEGE